MTAGRAGADWSYELEDRGFQPANIMTWHWAEAFRQPQPKTTQPIGDRNAPLQAYEFELRPNHCVCAAADVARWERLRF